MRDTIRVPLLLYELADKPGFGHFSALFVVGYHSKCFGYKRLRTVFSLIEPGTCD